MIDADIVISALGAAGAGSVFGSWVSGGRDRRTARADALSALSEVENARWGQSGVSDDDFLRALTRLETAFLIARLPRKPVSEYVILATTARWLSVEDIEDDPTNVFAGGIDGHLADAVKEGAGALARMAWSTLPCRRFYAWLLLRRVTAKVATVHYPSTLRSLELARKQRA